MKNNVVIGLIAIILGLFGVAAGIILYTDYYMNKQTSALPSASVEVWTDDGTGASEEMIPVEPSDAITGASEEPTADAGTGASEATPSPDAVSGATEDAAPSADAVSGASETSEDGYESDDKDEYESDEHEEREHEEHDEDDNDD